MKKFFSIFSLLLISTLCIQSADTLTIIHVNDTHTNLLPGGQRDGLLNAHYGGIARAATMVGYTKMMYPDALFLHAGDFSIGDLFFNTYFGVPELQFLQAMGLDAMTLGNHEWDLTAALLKMTIDTSMVQFPFLCANMVVINPDYQSLTEKIKPYTIKQVGNLKVGIFGLTTPEANIISQPLPDVFIDTNFVPIAGQIVTELRGTEACDVVVLLSHLGMYYDSFVAENIPGIDLIIGGHDHYELDAPYEFTNPMNQKVPYVQAGAQYQNCGVVQLIADNDVVSLNDYMLVKLDQQIPEYEQIKTYLDGLADGVEQMFGDVYSTEINEADADLKEFSTKDDANIKSDVAIYCARAYRDFTGTDIAIQANGSTARQIYKGPIVPADIYRAISYGFNMDDFLGFRICTFKMSGAAIYMGLEIGLAQLDINDEYLIQSDGLVYEVDMSQPPFSRVTGAVVNDEPLDPEKIYTVTANEMVPMMMEAFEIPISDLQIYPDDSEYEVVVNYFKKLNDIPEKITDVEDDNINLNNVAFEIQTYPNPSKGIVNVYGNVSEAGDYMLLIYNVEGVNVKSINLGTQSKGFVNHTVDMNELANGQYFFNMTNGTCSSKGSFVISK